MKLPICLAIALVTLATGEADAQRTRVTISAGDVAPSRGPQGDASRLAPSIPGVTEEIRSRLRVGGDSAQRIALDDFAWRGRVSSIEFDEQDARVFWDVKIVPDSTRGTIVRYRIDGITGGILDIREFTGIRGLARRPPR